MPAGNRDRNRPPPGRSDRRRQRPWLRASPGTAPRAENSRRMSSTPKNTPVTGALNVAAIPPPAPQATRMRIRFSGSPGPLAQARCQRGADLHDRSLPADRSAGPDAHGRGDRLDGADLRADPAAVIGNGGHYLRDAVAAGLAGPAVDQRPVDQAPASGDDHEERQAQPRQMSARGVALLAEGRVPGRQPGERRRSGTGMPPRRARLRLRRAVRARTVRSGSPAAPPAAIPDHRSTRTREPPIGVPVMTAAAPQRQSRPPLRARRIVWPLAFWYFSGRFSEHSQRFGDRVLRVPREPAQDAANQRAAALGRPDPRQSGQPV